MRFSSHTLYFVLTPNRQRVAFALQSSWGDDARRQPNSAAAVGVITSLRSKKTLVDVQTRSESCQMPM
jgi:hypothetical protein